MTTPAATVVATALCLLVSRLSETVDVLFQAYVFWTRRTAKAFDCARALLPPLNDS